MKSLKKVKVVSVVRKKFKRLRREEEIYIFLACGSGSILGVLTSMADWRNSVCVLIPHFNRNIELFKHYTNWPKGEIDFYQTGLMLGCRLGRVGL